MQQGALDCVEIPIEPKRMRKCVQRAIDQDAELRHIEWERALVMARVQSLTPREKQILERVAAGEITKSIARALAISHKTVEVHRTNIMRKMNVESAAGLLHLVAKFGCFPL